MKVESPHWLLPNMRRRLAHHHSILSQWSTAIFINNKEDENSAVTFDLTTSSIKYEKYRDEMDDYVTINH